MLWACILLPQLALDGVCRRRPDPDAALALLTGPAQRRVIQALNPAARALGLCPGQSLSAAHALSRDFACESYDPAQIERWQTLLAAWGYRFSSQVSLHFPRALLMEVESAFGLFGPWPRFEARLREELAGLGFSHRIALAPNPVAARMLTNAYDGLAITATDELREVLGRMPIERVGLAREHATAFKRMGLRTFAQVLALPRDALARRFPADVLLHVDRLLGQRGLALECYLPPDEFDERIELNFDVESHQALLFPVRRLLNDLAAFLAGRDAGVQRFVLHLEHAEGPDTQVPVGLLAAEREAAMLFELTRGRLEPVQLPKPVQAVRLLARQLPPFVPARRELFDDRPQQTQPWEQLRERLRARLGDEAIQNLQAHADHRPEKAWTQQAGPATSPSITPVPRPGWLLPAAEALSEPVREVLAGPERIESGWWDGGDVRRDYFRVETRSGRQAWVYRQVSDPQRLWLQGWFG